MTPHAALAPAFPVFRDSSLSPLPRSWKYIDKLTDNFINDYSHLLPTTHVINWISHQWSIIQWLTAWTTAVRLQYKSMIVLHNSKPILTQQCSRIHWDWCNYRKIQISLRRSCHFRCSLGRRCVFLSTEVRRDSCQMDYNETRWKDTHQMHLRMCFRSKLWVEVPYCGTGVSHWMWKPRFESGSRLCISPETVTGPVFVVCSKVTVPFTGELPFKTTIALDYLDL